MRKLTHSEISENRSKIENISSADRMPVVVAINSVRSAYNVGSIFRTSDGAMIEKLYLCGYTPHPPQKEVLKTALGSQDSVSWEYVNDPKIIIKKYKEIGYKIAALELTEKSTKYYEIDSYQFPICLIIGNEITGVQQDLLDECDFTLEIPQYGIKQSLNVAVAYGISIFDLRRIYDLNKSSI
ncbi:MAG: RNA methyltransferase [Ignavibacteriaceae bacterium]|jgi:tRNA G18 (ribose-2'-O)-methylase SpoU|nr:RNA methyltransferase [Ignavibacteriaceae bacterium]